MHPTESLRKVLLRDLFDLIAIDTSNPPGNELEAAMLVKDRMTSLGAICITQEIGPGRANTICRIPFSQGEEVPCLIFNSHLDVVPSGEAEWTFPPFEPRIVNGRVYGRGACDAKGSVAAMMAAIQMAIHSFKELRGELLFSAVAAEETGGLGTQFWLASREGNPKNSVAVIGEPSGLMPFIGHKGFSRRKLIVRGRSAHSSNPDQGLNAIYPAAHLAIFIEELNERLAQHSHPLLGSPVVSANVIHGGIKDNVIPDYCELQMDRRRIPGEGKDQFDRELDEWIRNTAARNPSFHYQVETLGVDKEPVIISPDEPIVQAVVDSIHEVIGKKEITRGFPGATDMTFLVHQGNIPTVIFGPGHLEQTHIVDEFVEINELELAALVYAQVIARILGPKKAAG